MDINRLVKTYLKIRDARTELKHRFDEEDQKLKAQLSKIENALLGHLNETQTDSVRTVAGTVYRQEEITPTGSDWDAFYDWIAATNNFDFLERRIKKTAVKEYAELNNGAIPPGVSVYREFVVRVRRQ